MTKATTGVTRTATPRGVGALLFLLLCRIATTASLSSPRVSTFVFAPNGVCVKPQFFVDADDGQQFTMRNVPGDGDCMFQAVALAASTSMGLGGNNALLRAVSEEIRQVVADILEKGGKGTLNIEGDRSVPANLLLHSSARGLHVNPSTYIEMLRKEGRDGGLYGGGPELTVLSNVLRRPISVYEIDRSVPITESECRIQRQGTFGDMFVDPCESIKDSVVLSPNLPNGAYSWHLHILVVDTGKSPEDKHACVLLPQRTTVQRVNDIRVHDPEMSSEP